MQKDIEGSLIILSNDPLFCFAYLEEHHNLEKYCEHDSLLSQQSIQISKEIADSGLCFWSTGY